MCTPGVWRMANGGPAEDAAPIQNAQSAFPNCPAGAVQGCPTPCVKEIKATAPATQRIRHGKVFDQGWKNLAASKKPASGDPVRLDDVFTTSASDKSVESNTPIYLIRGCKDILLEATTDPPNTAVTWKVENNGTNGTVPAITGKGVKATLKTNREGSFSVIATLGPCKVIWNVIFVWIKVGPAAIEFKSGEIGTSATGPAGDITGITLIESEHKFADHTVYPFTCSATVEMIGFRANGVKPSAKVHIHGLQNQTGNTLTGHYVKGTSKEMSVGGTPAVDSNTSGIDTPFMDSPGHIDPDDSATSPDKEVFNLIIQDPPNALLFNKHEHTKTVLRKVSGGFQFKTAIASRSDDAKNTIVVHAFTTWFIDFSGTIQLENDDPNTSGSFTATAAKADGNGSLKLIEAQSGGQDAGLAGFETFPPSSLDSRMAPNIYSP